jgi:glutaredoxin
VDEIVIYWRPDCVFCLNLLLRLRGTRLRYRKVDIRNDPEAKAFVRSVADGNETVPTVVVAGRTPGTSVCLRVGHLLGPDVAVVPLVLFVFLLVFLVEVIGEFLVDGELGRGLFGVGVVFPQHAASPGQGVLV